jgi:hypothetical protein
MRGLLVSMLGFSVLAAPSARADVLELKDGRILNGSYMGGTADTVRFQVDGQLQVLETDALVALTFTGPAKPDAAPPPATQPAQKPPPPPAAKEVTLPVDSPLLVRMKDGISSNNRAGTPFTTTLEYDFVEDGVKVLPAGTLIHGVVKSSTQARRLRGQSTLDLRLTDVVVGGQRVPIVSSAYQAAGEKEIREAARRAAAGAAIGAIVDGGEGAGKGAAIGAATTILRRGEAITIAPGALLKFSLAQPLTVKVGG